MSKKRQTTPIKDRIELKEDYLLATYFEFDKKEIARTERVHENCIICYDSVDNVVGIEILDLNKMNKKHVLYN
jgi:hypothetical protein